MATTHSNNQVENRSKWVVAGILHLSTGECWHKWDKSKQEGTQSIYPLYHSQQPGTIEKLNIAPIMAGKPVFLNIVFTALALCGWLVQGKFFSSGLGELFVRYSSSLFQACCAFRIQSRMLAKVILAEAKRESTLFVHSKVFMQQWPNGRPCWLHGENDKHRTILICTLHNAVSLWGTLCFLWCHKTWLGDTHHWVWCDLTLTVQFWHGRQLFDCDSDLVTTSLMQHQLCASDSTEGTTASAQHRSAVRRRYRTWVTFFPMDTLSSGSVFLFGWFEVGCAIWADEPNRCEPNRSTYRQPLPKVCLQHLHGQDEDWFGISKTLLVHCGLGIMHEEGICQIWILGFLRSKRSNLEVQKKWGVDV